MGGRVKGWLGVPNRGMCDGVTVVTVGRYFSSRALLFVYTKKIRNHHHNRHTVTNKKRSQFWHDRSKNWREVGVPNGGVFYIDGVGLPLWNIL